MPRGASGGVREDSGKDSEVFLTVNFPMIETFGGMPDVLSREGRGSGQDKGFCIGSFLHM